MTTYHVTKTGNNANNGLSQGSAFRDIQYGHNQLSSGDTLLVYPGDYNETVKLTTANITVRGTDPNNKPVIWANETANFQAVVQISNQCVFECFEVHGPLTDDNAYVYWQRAIQAGGSSTAVNQGHITIRNCYLHHVGGEGVLVHYQNGMLIEDCTVYKTGMTNYNGKDAARYGWWNGGNSFTRGENYVVRNNYIYEVWGEGLPFDFNVKNVQCYGNIVGQTWSGKIYIGEVQDAFIHSNLVFSPAGNSSFNNGPGTGLGVTDESYTPNVTDINNIHFYNNISVDCSSGIWIDHGYDEHNTKNVYFYNNTIIALRSGHAAIRMYGSSYHNVKVGNNIFYVSPLAQTTAGTFSTSIQFNHNLWNITPAAGVSGVNDIIANPKLLNPEAIVNGSGLGNIFANNYKITESSPAIDAGNTELTTDFFGNERNGTPDLGAHEFVGSTNPVINVEISVGEGEETGTEPHTVNFDSSGSFATNDIVSYLWDFGDNNQSDEANPVHVYTTVGLKTVSLTLTDTQGDSETSIEEDFINVLANPGPSIHVEFSVGTGETEGPAPHTVNFDSSNSSAQQGIAAYLWDFGDGDQSSAANPSHTYSANGFYTIALTITDNNGNASTLTKENYIITHYSTGESTAVAYYKFEEGSGAIIKDYAGGTTQLDLTIEDIAAVEWLEKGLRIIAPTVLKTLTSAQKIIRACQVTNEISIEVWVKPANLEQKGPAHIVGISKDIYSRNVTLGQGGLINPLDPTLGDFYMVRLRTTDTDDNGRPEVETPPGSLKVELQHVVYTRNASGDVKIYINNVLVLEETVNGTFDWDPSYALYLANEGTGYRSWLGEIHMVRIYATEIPAATVAENFAIGPHIEVNAAFTIGENEEIGELPHSVHFDATASAATYAIESYTWDFGDGSTGTGQTISHVYAEKGEFYPSLTVVDVLGNLHTVTRENPIFVIEPEIGRVEEGLQVLYTFLEGDGGVIKDISPGNNPLDLNIEDNTAVTWLPTGLRVHQPAKITSVAPAKKIIDACIANNEITIEAWIQSARGNQSGPARIVSVSKNLVERYFTLAQGLWGIQPGNLYDVRLRRESSKANGTPSLSSNAGSAKTVLTHVVFTWDTSSGIGKIYLDGELHKAQEMPGNFSSWSDGYYDLNLVNEATGGRYWLGDLFLVAIYSKALDADEVEQNFQVGKPYRPQTPENFRRFLLLHPHYNPSGDPTGLIAYGAQYPDMQCALIWEGNSEFEVLPDIEAVINQYSQSSLHWIDE